MSTHEFRKDMITFWDIPFKVEEGTFSPNTFITRHILKMKGIPFHTEWIGFADIQEFGRKLGVEPTVAGPHKFFSVPIIHDPSTGVTIADSFRIAQYLDKTYPDTRRSIPPGTDSLHQAFRTAAQSLEGPIYQFVMPPTYDKIERPADRAFFARSREGFFGKKVEDLTPKGEEAKTEWSKVKGFYAQYDNWFEGDNEFVGGDEPIFADIMLAGKVFWLRTVFGKGSSEWEDIKSWNGGRWEKLLTNIEKSYA